MIEPAPKYHNQSLGALEVEFITLKGLIDRNKKEQEGILEEVKRRVGNGLADALAAEGKEVGSITKELDDGVKVKGEIKQSVKWDAGQLQTIASTMTWPQIQHYFKITFSVPEKIYNALDPESALFKALTKARTTEKGDLSVSFAPGRQLPTDGK